jgi:uncharacterized protein
VWLRCKDQHDFVTNGTIEKTLNVLVIGTSGCNLACHYCYCDHEQLKTLDLTGFVRVFNKLDIFFPANIEFNIVFHGGEPLLLGKSFYREVFSFLAGQRRALRTSIQTNLTLLDEEFMTIFRANNCVIGTSIDGSKSMHDSNRVYQDGRGTYDDVRRAVDMLREDDALFGGIVVTLNETNIVSAERLYDSLACFRGVPIGFSIVSDISEPSRAIVDVDRLGVFLVDLFDIWVRDNNPLRLSFFENVLRNCLGINYSPECTFTERCAEHFVAINAVGDVFPCCDFVGIQKFCYGNIMESDFQDIWNSSVRSSLLARLSQRALSGVCGECEHFDICKSGCEAKTTGGGGGRDQYCAAYRMLFSHVRGHLPALVAPTSVP